MMGALLFGERSKADCVLPFEIEIRLADKAEMMFAYAFGLWFGLYHVFIILLLFSPNKSKLDLCLVRF